MLRFQISARMSLWFTLVVFALAGLVGLSREGLAAEDQTAQQSSQEKPVPQVVGATLDCQQLAALIDQQKTLIARESGQIKRELAALRDDLSKPGVREIFAGIGYIFGLAGMGLYVHCRRSQCAQASSKAR
jgi:hypothetical protein